MDLGLRGKSALVTGSTSGLGLACATALANEGVHVTITGRRSGLVQQEAKKLGGSGIHADLTAPETPRILLDKTGPVDILVVSTGGPSPGRALDVEPEAYEQALALLVTPVVRLTHLVVGHMQEQKWGRIVFVTSTAVREPIEILVLSNSVRSAVHGFAKSLARQVASDGVTVNCVMPGRIATDRVASLDGAAAEANETSVEEIRRRAEQNIPAGRYGDPAEFGATVAFLCSRQAAYINGASIPVDGASLSSHF